MSQTTPLVGACHCGAIRVELNLSKPPEELKLRACQCSFCRRHGVLAVSDPKGHVAFDVEDPALLQRYRFGAATADFLVCNRCGVYAGAVLEDQGEAWSVVNVVGMGVAEFAGRGADPADYDSETRDGRITRRKTTWTPTEVRIGGADQAA